MGTVTILTCFFSVSLMLMLMTESVKSDQDDYTIKMVGCDKKESVYAGRLEMLYLNRWGTICGDTFDNKAASVACYSLGYERGRAIYIHNEYGGPGDRPIILKGLNCTGNESHLDGCQHPPYNGNGFRDCTHDLDVYVACEAYKYQNGKDVLGYQIKLCNNITANNCSSETEKVGLLQIKYNGVWGTVCGTDYSVRNEEVNVTCRSVLRHIDESSYWIYGKYHNSSFPPPNFMMDDNVPVWLGTVECDGSERNLGSCVHPAWGAESCNHNNDIWVTCCIKSKSPGPPMPQERCGNDIPDLLFDEKKNRKRYQL